MAKNLKKAGTEVTTLYHALSMTVFIDVNQGMTSIQDYINDYKEYNPDFSITPLVLTPRAYILGSTAVDKSVNVIPTAEVTNVEWYSVSRNVQTRLNTGMDYTIQTAGADKGKLTVRKNLAPDSDLIFRFKAQFKDARNNTFELLTQDFNVLCTSSTSESLRALLTTPLGITNDYKVTHLQVTQKVYLGDAELTQDVVRWWYKDNVLLRDANANGMTGYNGDTLTVPSGQIGEDGADIRVVAERIDMTNVNLISRQMLLNFNRLCKDDTIVVRGSDAEAAYLEIKSQDLYSKYSNVPDTAANHIFPNLTFKPNTRYTLAASYKNAEADSTLILRFVYTDGVTTGLSFISAPTRRTIAVTSDPNRTIKKITSTYIVQGTVKIYDILLIQGVYSADKITFTPAIEEGYKPASPSSKALSSAIALKTIIEQINVNIESPKVVAPNTPFITMACVLSNVQGVIPHPQKRFSFEWFKKGDPSAFDRGSVISMTRDTNDPLSIECLPTFGLAKQRLMMDTAATACFRSVGKDPGWSTSNADFYIVLDLIYKTPVGDFDTLFEISDKNAQLSMRMAASGAYMIRSNCPPESPGSSDRRFFMVLYNTKLEDGKRYRLAIHCDWIYGKVKVLSLRVNNAQVKNGTEYNDITGGDFNPDTFVIGGNQDGANRTLSKIISFQVVHSGLDHHFGRGIASSSPNLWLTDVGSVPSADKLTLTPYPAGVDLNALFTPL